MGESFEHSSLLALSVVDAVCASMLSLWCCWSVQVRKHHIVDHLVGIRSQGYDELCDMDIGHPEHEGYLDFKDWKHLGGNLNLCPLSYRTEHSLSES
jgi:hypothetical protein